MSASFLFSLFFTSVLLSFLTTSICTRFLILRFRRQKIGQSILEIGPKWHKSKEGTPTMGGIAFLVAFLINIAFYLCLSLRYDFLNATSPFLLCALFIIGNGAIGLWDDLTKYTHHRNEGLRARSKFFLQSILAILFLLALSTSNAISTNVSVPLIGQIDLGFFYYFFAFFFLTGLINSVNLTDGIDGLAGSVTLTVCGFLCCACVFLGQISSFFLSATVLGICIGFLLFNLHPARIFMGDTGSLFLGSVISSLAIWLNIPILICVVGFFYLIEAVSVILQVLYFKLTRKRLFKMAPFHHHLEQSGFSEERIVALAVAITLVGSVVAFLLNGWKLL